MMKSRHVKIAPRASLLLALLLAAVLGSSAALTAMVLSQNHERERLALAAEAQARAAFAGQYVDRALLGLVKTLTLLPWSSMNDKSGRDAFYVHSRAALDGSGVELVARDQSLAALLPSDAGQIAFGDDLDDAAREAAAKALRERKPQISTYGTGSKDAGENLWIAIAAEGNNPIIVQARIPASYFTTTLESLATPKSWLLAIVRPDGKFLARFGEETNFAKFAFSDRSNSPPADADFAASLTDVSQFGWRVGAATPFAALDAASARYWSWFILIMSLLTMLSIAGSFSVLQRLAAQHARTPALANIEDKPDHFPSRMPNLAMPVDRLRSVLDAGGIGTWEWRSGSSVIHGDGKAAELAGLAAGTQGKSAFAILKNIDAKHRIALLAAARKALREPQHISLDLRFTGFDSKPRWLAVRGTSTTSGAGGPIGLTGIVYDVTEATHALAKTDALLREVSHRTKNLLALILAMARLTARDNFDVKTYLKQFALRVAGLSASQDIIVAADWQSADLGALALGEVEAVARATAPRISISGPAVAVTPEAAQTLGIIITELTLNAVEHGSLSAPAGRVILSWDLPDAATFRMSWRESGGPSYDPAKPKRYGMTIVERLAVQGLRASLSFGGGSDGFEWTLEAPVSSVRAPAIPPVIA